MTRAPEGFTAGFIGVFPDNSVAYFRTAEAATQATGIHHFPAWVPDGATYYEDTETERS